MDEVVHQMTFTKETAQVLERLRGIVAKLDDVTETLTWGHPNWRVGGAKGRLFLGWGGDGRGILGFKSDPRERDSLLTDPRFTVAPYVGKHGWLSLDLNVKAPNWTEIARLVGTSHALVAGAAAPQRPLTKPSAGISALERVRGLIASIADVVETPAWGHPKWRAGGAKGRIFLALEGQGTSLCIRLPPAKREQLLKDGRFSIPPRGGATWTSLDLAQQPPSWREIKRLIGAGHAFAAEPEPQRSTRRMKVLER